MKGKLSGRYLLSVFLLCGCIYACIQDDSITKDSKADRFFNATEADEGLRFIVKQLKQKNDSADFVASFVNKYGYPLWKDAYIFPEGDKLVFAVPVKSTVSKAEIEAIWYFSAGTNRTDYRIYTRDLADRIAAQTGADGVEDTWMFDYFTRNALHKVPASGLDFLPLAAVTSRVSTVYVENIYCSHVISYTGNGENFVDHGYSCWSTPGGYFSFDDEGNGSIADGGSGGGDSGDSSCSDATAASLAPRAYNIFRNSHMTEQNWKILETMIDKIMEDCMGEELYKGLKSFLKGKKLTIQFKNGAEGSFGFQGTSTGIALGMQMESNQLLHEMFHAYRAYQEDVMTYNSSILNGEIEAWYAQYLYTSKLPEYKDSKWERRDNTDSRRIRIKNLTTFIDNKGYLRSGKSTDELEFYILNIIIPVFHQSHYTAEKYPFDFGRSALNNFSNIKKLTTNCP